MASSDIVARLRSASIAVDSAWNLVSRCHVAADEIERLEKQVAQLRPLAEYGMAFIEVHREDCGDLDGAWLEDTAQQYGLLHTVIVSEPCGEECRCVEYWLPDQWPVECLRYSPAALKAFRVLGKRDE